ncbi:MAG: GNAT family N-acetyltransferase [Solirubrobacteraceae bacterium]
MELRGITGEEADAFLDAAMVAFHHAATEREREQFHRLAEPERSLVYDDGGAIVATASIYTRDMSVCGGTIPCAAVTVVTVLPTHRRRGLLTGLMRRQLDDLRDGGEAVAVLKASEGGIYGRFGYAPAAYEAVLRARRADARLAIAPESASPLRIVVPEDAIEAMRPIHEAERARRAGMLDRLGAWWEDRLFPHWAPPGEGPPRRAVLTEDGYALYEVSTRDDPRGPQGEVAVRELVATTPAARARLWAFLLDQDLTATLSWGGAPVDAPLRLTLANPRGADLAPRTALWLRLVDLPRALAARAYDGDPDVVLEVADAFCPWNAGRWRLAGGACERTTAAADLALDAGALAAAYLGGTTLAELAAAGRVDELAPGALARASPAFRSALAPWSPDNF